MVSRITDLDRDLERFGRELLLFALENIHAEILSGQLEPDYVFSRMQRDCLVLITICPEQEARRIEEQCQRLILSYQRVMQGVMTCCISQPCTPDQSAGPGGKRLIRSKTMWPNMAAGFTLLRRPNRHPRCRCIWI